VTDSLLSRRELLAGIGLGAAALPAEGAAPQSAPPAPSAVVEGAQYGFSGDGTTSNDAPFAAAFAALAKQSGGLLRLAPGTYRFSKPLMLPGGTVIEGAGMAVTVLACSDDITGVAFTSGRSRCGLRALSLEGTAKKGTGLQIGDHDFTGNHHVRDVLIRGWAVGCRLAGALWTTFDNVTFDANGRGLDFNAGWGSGYSTTVAFRQCVFSANDYGGVTASNTPIMSSTISWLGCTIERNCRADPAKYPQMAFASGAYGISGFVIDGCYFEAGGKPPPDAIHANGLRCGRISNCNFYDSAYAIRDVVGGAASYITIFGNRFVGSTAQNIRFERDTQILAYCNADGGAPGTLTGPGSGSLNATALQSHLVSEGEWMPVLVGSACSGCHGYVRQSGLYNRVGNQVMIRAHITTLSVDRSMSGHLRIGGLPFTAAGPPGLPAIVSVSASGVTHARGYSALHGLIAPGGTAVELIETGSAVRSAHLPSSSVAGGAEFILSATYIV
jgi:hypothetical protein